MISTRGNSLERWIGKRSDSRDITTVSAPTILWTIRRDLVEATMRSIVTSTFDSCQDYAQRSVCLWRCACRTGGNGNGSIVGYNTNWVISNPLLLRCTVIAPPQLPLLSIAMPGNRSPGIVSKPSVRESITRGRRCRCFVARYSPNGEKNCRKKMTVNVKSRLCEESTQASQGYRTTC